jgi:RES domain-containing protein
VSLPATTLVRAADTHRLIPSRYSAGGDTVLTRIADHDDDLAALVELDGATNDRLAAEAALLPGIGIHELVFGIPNHRIINAAFCHAHPQGSRFNGPDRGCWYAALEIETSQAEVAFHKAVEYAEVGRFDDSITYDDYLADITAALHDLRADPAYADCLAADSYVASQGLAEQLLADGSLGLVYPSVRRPGGTCLAIMRPALVGNVQRAATYRFSWRGTAQPVIERL